MKPRILQAPNLPLQSHSAFNLPLSILQKPPLPFLSRNASFRFPSLQNSVSKVAKAVRFDGLVMDINELEKGDCELVVETVISRTLPPVLTLEDGLYRIKKAVEELAINPPSPSGVFRFQVAVPPGPKAFDWFCCQPELSNVYPLFFMSMGAEDPNSKSLYLTRTRGVFGIGAAAFFTHSLHTPRRSESCQKLVCRCLTSDSVLITTYGFMDVHFDTDSSSINHEAGSFYFLIPEIELDETGDLSVLAATLAWDDTAHYSIKEAIKSFELSYNQILYHFSATTERCLKKFIPSAFRKANPVEDRTFKMVSGTPFLFDTMENQSDLMQMREIKYSSQFCFSFSPGIGVSSNVLDKDYARERTCSLRDFENINAVWATLIIEECFRLGLMYFCIAPGSRSSPLAIAASSHPLITCIPCFDERSLAFHAVGYGKGSHKPAVIITSSGTAVSNLLPAVVEASLDFVPLLLLTADRPPELLDTGANQAINQVNHFGSFVRFFFNLPTPTDEIPVRMLLTTIDSAVHWATSSPSGPVHVNCPFREPLDGSPRKWNSKCLKGLDNWMSNNNPFTEYIQMQCSTSLDGDNHKMVEIFEIIHGVKNGLLLISEIRTEDESWAALLLAKHLRWPVVADILSGLRLRKSLSRSPNVEEDIVFIDHIDHALLSDSVRNSIQCDAIIQIGSRITSKRISQMLEDSYPCSYILVDDHPYRHDPSHLITHRIQCSIIKFAGKLIKAQPSRRNNNWCAYLQTLNEMISWEISFQILLENSLTEPYVVHVISEMLSDETVLFLGNSMPIRDADMYGCISKNHTDSVSNTLLSAELPCRWIRVAGNRGASGIDGLLSTAIGFAVGSNKRVICLIGDISFLHDTNGLASLNQRITRKPVTVLLINNRGGAIFGLLPIAERTNPRVLDRFFYTSHDISMQNLCMAHGVRHLQVNTKVGLHEALRISQRGNMDCLIEIDGSICSNSAFHSTLRKSACQAADYSLSILSKLCISNSILDWHSLGKIKKLEYSLYRIRLSAPTTTRSNASHHSSFLKKGYILSLFLDDGSIGYGEVAPLDFHEENLLLVEDQLRFLVHVIRGSKLGISLTFLKGSFTSWIRANLGIPEHSLFPSVRCGLEMAMLNAMAVGTGSSLLSTVQPKFTEKGDSERSLAVNVCGLIDSNGTPAEVAYIASSLIEEGFTAIKIKVARRADPSDDAAVLQEVRRKVGKDIELRVDANRKWTFEEAICFGALVKDCDLQYIEEPVQEVDDIIKYCEECGLPVALDETIDNFQENPLPLLAKYSHPGIVAVVIKPSVIGGFEKAALIARWAQQLGKMVVVSAAFESSIGLSSYVLFSHLLSLQCEDVCRVTNSAFSLSIAHGLGTYRWLDQDVTTRPLRICYDRTLGFVGAYVDEASQLLLNVDISQRIIIRTYTGEQVLSYTLTINYMDFDFHIKVLEFGLRNNDNVIVFLHGFLGTGEEWTPIMKAMSGSARCISIDLPGHGKSKIVNHVCNVTNQAATLSVEVVSAVVSKLIEEITPGKVILVGYSMGARIALRMVLRATNKINGAVIISGSPGVKDRISRKVRQAKDNSRARCLAAYGLHHFVDNWYAGELWESLRSHPHFEYIVASRMVHDDVHSLARSLSDLSVGKQTPLWGDLKQCDCPLLFIVGEKDVKFKGIAKRMCSEIGRRGRNRSEIVEVPDCGHAVHLENPLSVIGALRRFMSKVAKGSSPKD